MAVPYRKTSKTSKRLRRSHIALAKPTLAICSNCGEKIRPHHVCAKCGYYDGRKVK